MEVRLPAGATGSSPTQNEQMDCGAHTTGTGASSPAGEAAGASRWPPTTTQLPTATNCVEPYLHSPIRLHMPLSRAAVRGVSGVKKTIKMKSTTRFVVGRDSSVGTATRFGLDGPGIESRWRRLSATFQIGPGPTQPPRQWVPRHS
jgi:hypothetical protein